jgi:hypothetical protein
LLAAVVLMALAGCSSTVTVTTGPTAACPDSPDAGFVTIFNGQNLDGWETINNDGAAIESDNFFVGNSFPTCGINFSAQEIMGQTEANK